MSNDYDSSRTTAEILADGAVWVETPNVLDRVLADISQPVPVRRRRIRVVAAVAVVGVLATLAIFLRNPSDPADFLLAGTDLAPEATAEVRVTETPAGIILRLEVERLEPAPAGSYYQGWVVSESGEVSVGTFHMRGGDGSVAFWSGVELDRYPMLIVTLQKETGGPARSDTVVLSGRA